LEPLAAAGAAEARAAAISALKIITVKA
jgi:hypothetical protein